MSCGKSLQCLIGVVWIIGLVGCSAPTTPAESSAPMHSQAISITPTETQITTADATPTLKIITNFEECVALGNPVQNTFPRQCIGDNEEIFQEALDTGIVFSKTYGGKGRDTAYAILSTKDGGHLITGATNDFQCLILKIDASNEKEWEYTLGQELREEFQFTNAWFHCELARQTPDGGYMVMGSGFNGETHKYFTIKLDQDGKWITTDEIGEREGKIAYLDVDGNLTWLNSFGLPRKVIETSNGGYAIAGTFPGGSPDNSIHIIKADDNGGLVWEKNLCLDEKVQEIWEEKVVCHYSNLWDAIQLQDGGYAMTGGFGNGIWLVKTDDNGNIEWIKSFIQELGNSGRALVQMPDGGFLVAGEQLMNQRYQDGILIRTDSAGILQWSKTFGGDQHDWFIGISQGLKDEIIIIGGTQSFGEGAEDIWLLGIDSKILK